MRKFLTSTDRVLPVHHPRVLVETAVMHGADRDALFEGSELTAQMLTSPDMRVTPLQYGILCRNALRLTKNPALGLLVGRNIGLGQLGLLGFLMQNTPTLGDALAKFLQFSTAVTPAWEIELERRPDGAAVLTFTGTLPLGNLNRFIHEAMLAAFDTLARALNGGRPLPVRRIEFPFAEKDHAPLIRELFYDVPMAFGCPVARVEFDASLLDTPIATADPAAAAIAEQAWNQQIPIDPAQEGLLTHVRRLVANEAGPPRTLAEIAQILQTSTRTLRRELNKMHTSYSQLVDDARQRRAREWVKTNSLPLEVLAAKLGFSTVGSFRRAFKRWTGNTPAAWRSRAKKSA